MGPALSGPGIGTSMIVAWKGAGNDQQRYASFDVWRWSAQATIPGTGAAFVRRCVNSGANSTPYGRALATTTSCRTRLSMAQTGRQKRDAWDHWARPLTKHRSSAEHQKVLIFLFRGLSKRGRDQFFWEIDNERFKERRRNTDCRRQMPSLHYKLFFLDKLALHTRMCSKSFLR